MADVPGSLLRELQLAQFAEPEPAPQPAQEPEPSGFHLPTWDELGQAAGNLVGGIGQAAGGFAQGLQRGGEALAEQPQEPPTLPTWDELSGAQQQPFSPTAAAPPPGSGGPTLLSFGGEPAAAGPPSPAPAAVEGADYYASATGSPYEQAARSAAQRAGIDPDLFVRQIRQESGFDPGAGSPAGAQGIAQFMPGTARDVATRLLGVDESTFWGDPNLQLEGAARLMREYLQQYGGDYRKALAAYNAGPGNVQTGRAFELPETQNYLKIILGDEDQAARLPQGSPLARQDPAKADVLGAARAELGKPYAGPIVGGAEADRWGSVGWDCSSFVSGVLRKVGVNVTPFTDAAARETVTVASDQARPGDIVFFRYSDPSQPGVEFPHMAIYAGDGKIIDAAYGRGVTERALPTGLGEIVFKRPAGMPTQYARAAVDEAEDVADETGGETAAAEKDNQRNNPLAWAQDRLGEASTGLAGMLNAGSAGLTGALNQADERRRQPLEATYPELGASRDTLEAGGLPATSAEQAGQGVLDWAAQEGTTRRPTEEEVQQATEGQSFLDRLSSSLRGAAVGTLGSASALLGGTAEAVGGPENEAARRWQQLEQASQQIVNAHPEWQMPSEQMSDKNPLSNPRLYAHYLGTTVPSIITGITAAMFGSLVGATAGAAAAGGVAGQYLSTFLGEGGSAYQQARAGGQDLATALKAGYTVGAINAAIEQVPIFRGWDGLPALKQAKERIARALSGNLRDALKETTADMLREGGEEVLQQLVQNAVARTYDEHQNLFEDVIDSGLAGATLPGVFGAYRTGGAAYRTATDLATRREGERQTALGPAYAGEASINLALGGLPDLVARRRPGPGEQEPTEGGGGGGPRSLIDVGDIVSLPLTNQRTGQVTLRDAVVTEAPDPQTGVMGVKILATGYETGAKAGDVVTVRAADEPPTPGEAPDQPYEIIQIVGGEDAGKWTLFNRDRSDPAERYVGRFDSMTEARAALDEQLAPSAPAHEIPEELALGAGPAPQATQAPRFVAVQRQGRWGVYDNQAPQDTDPWRGSFATAAEAQRHVQLLIRDAQLVDQGFTPTAKGRPVTEEDLLGGSQAPAVQQADLFGGPPAAAPAQAAAAPAEADAALEQKVLDALGKHAPVRTISSLTQQIKHPDGREVRQALDRLEQQGRVVYIEGMGNNRKYRLLPTAETTAEPAPPEPAAPAPTYPRASKYRKAEPPADRDFREGDIPHARIQQVLQGLRSDQQRQSQRRDDMPTVRELADALGAKVDDILPALADLEAQSSVDYHVADSPDRGQDLVRLRSKGVGEVPLGERAPETVEGERPAGPTPAWQASDQEIAAFVEQVNASIAAHGPLDFGFGTARREYRITKMQADGQRLIGTQHTGQRVAFVWDQVYPVLQAALDKRKGLFPVRPRGQPENIAPGPTEQPAGVPPQSAQQQTLRARSGGQPPTMTWASSTARPGERYDFELRIVPLDDLIPSHDEAFRETPAYPQELQPRDRNAAAYRQQVERNAAKLDPAQLLEEYHSLDRGAPIIGPDMVVESGNGRVMSLRLARRDHPEQFQKYEDALVNTSYVGEGYLLPVVDGVLVRVRHTPVDRVAFAQEANGRVSAAPQASEQAVIDAQAISDEMLARFVIRPGESIDRAIASIANAQVVRDWVQKLPDEDATTLLDDDGNLSATGGVRFRNALFRRVYDNAAGRILSDALANELDPQIGGIRSALYNSLPAMAKLAGMIRRGERDPAYDITNDLAGAVAKLVALRFAQTRTGMTVSQYLKTQPMFGAELSDAAQLLLTALDNMRRAPVRTRGFLEQYVEQVLSYGDPNQTDMFGNAVPPPTKEALLEGLTRTEDAGQEQPAEPEFAQQLQEAQNAAPAEQPAAAPEPAAPNPEPGAAPGRGPGQRGPDERGAGVPGDRRTAPVVVARPESTPTVSTAAIPGDVLQHLMPHQQQGAALALAAMETDPGGFLLADGTGAGKTRQILAVAETHRRQGRSVVIVAPPATLNIRKGRVTGSYADDSRAMGITLDLAEGGSITPGAITMLRSSQLTPGAKIALPEDTVLILDEAHEFKNLESGRAHVAQQLIDQAQRVMFASATPGDKPSHMTYLMRMGMLEGRSVRETALMLGYVRNQRRAGGRLVEVWERHSQVTSYELAERLERLFERLTAAGRMVKREVSMDGLRIEVEKHPLTEAARKELEVVRKAFSLELAAGGMKKANALMALRRVLEPHKIERTVDQVERSLRNGRQAVVFMARVNDSDIGVWKKRILPSGETERYRQHILDAESTMRALKAALAKRGITDVVEVHGEVETGKRAAGIEAFQAGSKRVLLATTESGGTGINLDDRIGDRPRDMVILTPPFSAIHNVQAIGRIWRATTVHDPNNMARVVYVAFDDPVDTWNHDIVMTKLMTLGATVAGQVEMIGRAVDNVDINDLLQSLSLDREQQTMTPEQLEEHVIGFVSRAAGGRTFASLRREMNIYAGDSLERVLWNVLKSMVDRGRLEIVQRRAAGREPVELTYFQLPQAERERLAEERMRPTRERLLEVLRDAPRGLTFEQLRAQLEIPRNSAQLVNDLRRILDGLVADGALEAIEPPGTYQKLYRLPQPAAAIVPPSAGAAGTEARRPPGRPGAESTPPAAQPPPTERPPRAEPPGEPATIAEQAPPLTEGGPTLAPAEGEPAPIPPAEPAPGPAPAPATPPPAPPQQPPPAPPAQPPNDGGPPLQPPGGRGPLDPNVFVTIRGFGRQIGIQDPLILDALVKLASRYRFADSMWGAPTDFPIIDQLTVQRGLTMAAAQQQARDMTPEDGAILVNVLQAGFAQAWNQLQRRLREMERDGRALSPVEQAEMQQDLALLSFGEEVGWLNKVVDARARELRKVARYFGLGLRQFQHAVQADAADWLAQTLEQRGDILTQAADIAEKAQRGEQLTPQDRQGLLDAAEVLEAEAREGNLTDEDDTLAGRFMDDMPEQIEMPAPAEPGTRRPSATTVVRALTPRKAYEELERRLGVVQRRLDDAREMESPRLWQELRAEQAAIVGEMQDIITRQELKRINEPKESQRKADVLRRQIAAAQADLAVATDEAHRAGLVALIDQLDAELRGELNRQAAITRGHQTTVAMRRDIRERLTRETRWGDAASAYSRAFRQDRLDQALGRAFARAQIQQLATALREAYDAALESPADANAYIDIIAPAENDLRALGSIGVARADAIRRRAWESGLQRLAGTLEEDQRQSLLAVMETIQPGQRGGRERLLRVLRDLRTPNFVEKLNSYTIISLLSSPLTWGLFGVNNISNLIRAVTYPTMTLPTMVGWDIVASAAGRRPRSVFASEIPAAWGAMAGGMQAGLQMFVQVMRHGRTAGQVDRAIVLADLRSLHREPLAEINGPLGWFFTLGHMLSTRPLQASDTAISWVLRAGILASKIQREAERRFRAGEFKPGTRELAQSVNEMAAAIQANLHNERWVQREADRLTDTSLYRQGLPGVLQQISSLRYARPGASAAEQARAAALFSLLPIIKTPYNWLAEQVKESPLLLPFNAWRVGALGRGPSAREEAADLALRQKAGNRGMPPLEQRRRVEQAQLVQKTMTGLTFTALAVILLVNDNLTGDGPPDEEDRRMLPPGWQPRSIRYWDARDGQFHYQTYDGMPFALHFGAVANAYEAYKYQWQRQDKKPSDFPQFLLGAAARTALGFGSAFLNQPMALGLRQYGEALTNPDKPADPLIASQISRFIPTGGLVAWMARAGDSMQREALTWSQRVQERTPFRGALPERRTILGEAQPNDQTGLAALFPRHSVERDRELLQVLRRYDVGVPQPQKTLTNRGVVVDLTRDEQRRLQQLRGDYLLKAFEAAGGEASLSRVPPAARPDVLQRLVDQSGDAARDRLEREIGGPELTRRAREFLERRRVAS